MKSKIKLFSVFLAVLLTMSLFLPTMAANNAGLTNFQKLQSYTEGTFHDVKTADWFYENIKSVYELGLMIGRDSATFGTDGNMTVAEAMTIAARLHAIYHTGTADFTQSEIWYQVYTDYCKANGIADPAVYKMDVPVTRAQFAAIFANAFPSEAFEAINTVEDNAIPDVKEDSSYASAIYKLYRAGILVGNDQNGVFTPNSNIRRSEAAAIVTRMAQPALRRTITLKAQADSSPNGHTGADSIDVDFKDGETEEAPETTKPEQGESTRPEQGSDQPTHGNDEPEHGGDTEDTETDFGKGEDIENLDVF